MGGLAPYQVCGFCRLLIFLLSVAWEPLPACVGLSPEGAVGWTGSEYEAWKLRCQQWARVQQSFFLLLMLVPTAWWSWPQAADGHTGRVRRPGIRLAGFSFLLVLGNEPLSRGA